MAIIGGVQGIQALATMALDRTNLSERRVVKAATAVSFLVIMLVDQFGARFFFDSVKAAAVYAPLIATILIANGLYDYILLHRCAMRAREDAANG